MFMNVLIKIVVQGVCVFKYPAMQALVISIVIGVPRKSPIFCKSKNIKENYKGGSKELKELRRCNILT